MNLLFSLQLNVNVSRAHTLNQNIAVCMPTIKLVRRTIRNSFTTATRSLLIGNWFNAWWIGNGRNSLVPALLMPGRAYFLWCLNWISEFWSVDQLKQDIPHTQLFSTLSWEKKKKKSQENNWDGSVVNMNLSWNPSFHWAVPLIYVAQRSAALPNVLLQQRHPLKCEKEQNWHSGACPRTVITSSCLMQATIRQTALPFSRLSDGTL